MLIFRLVRIITRNQTKIFQNVQRFLPKKIDQEKKIKPTTTNLTNDHGGIHVKSPVAPPW